MCHDLLATLLDLRTMNSLDLRAVMRKLSWILTNSLEDDRRNSGTVNTHCGIRKSCFAAPFQQLLNHNVSWLDKTAGLIVSRAQFLLCLDSPGPRARESIFALFNGWL